MSTRPNPKSLIGLFILLIGLGLYAGLIGWLSQAIGEMHFALELLFYAIAGIIWIIPARWLMRWMTKEP